MKSQMMRAFFLLAILVLLNACSSTADSTAPSGPPVAGEHKSDDSGFGAGVGPGGANGKVSF